MDHFRSPAKAYDEAGNHIGPGKWLDVVRESNRVALLFDLPEPFQAPSETGKWWAGGYFEEYPTFRILHREDGSVSILAKHPSARRILESAVRRLGL